MAYIEQPVLIEDTAPLGHAQAVAAAFARAGFQVEVAPRYGRRGADLLPWIVRVVLLVPTAHSLLSSPRKQARTPTPQLRSGSATSRQLAGTGEGSIHLVDPDASNVVLSSGLSENAIDALGEINWDEHRGDYLVWDASREEWRDLTKRG